MTRLELTKIDANRVRKDKTLFAQYRKYLDEDVKYMYASGKLPQGCFGCQFKTIFSKWKKYVLLESGINNNKDMAVYNAKNVEAKTVAKSAGESKKAFELKSPSKKLYFKGKVLSKSSSDADWADFINYPEDEKARESRKALFKVLPQGVETSASETSSQDGNETLVEDAKASQNVEEDADASVEQESDVTDDKKSDEEPQKDKKQTEKKTVAKKSIKVTKKK